MFHDYRCSYECNCICFRSKYLPYPPIQRNQRLQIRITEGHIGKMEKVNSLATSTMTSWQRRVHPRAQLPSIKPICPPPSSSTRAISSLCLSLKKLCLKKPEIAICSNLTMKKWDYYEHKNPSFSSTLLDEIYRSIDDGEKKPAGETKFYRETSTVKKHIKSRAFEDKEMANLRRACMIEKWMEKKVDEKGNVYTKQERYRKMPHDFDHDRDALFFTSTSSSSDSSSGGFSSSDTESVFGTRSLTPSSCFASSRLKAIRTGTCGRPAETERKKTLFQGKNDRHVFDEFPKSKSSGLKKVKQPISPGVRLAGLINSLFTAGNTRKSKNMTATERKVKTGEESTCSSASSFARSCLSKSSASSRGNGAKRSVRFCPVSVIFDEDCRPYGHKCLYEEDGSSLMSVSIPTAWKIGRSPVGKSEGKELKSQLAEKSRKVEAAARELLIKNLNGNNNDDDDDDNASCSSSDLFELDHLEMIGQRRYSQELPVYETTHVEKNRAISKGLLL